jgi:hypothetical protein
MMYQTNPPRSPKETLPTMYDLPSEEPEEPGLPDEFHYFQPQLLRETCQLPALPQEQTFIGTDLNLFWFEPLQLGLGVWAGVYQQTEGVWLRWYNGQGDWVPTDAEQVKQEQAKLLRAAANLLATGMEPEQVAEVLGLSIEQVKAL